MSRIVNPSIAREGRGEGWLDGAYLGATDGGVELPEVLLENEVGDVWGQVAHKKGMVYNMEEIRRFG